MKQTLADDFSKNFDVVAANATETLDEAYSLRYQVYCVEHDYEDATRFPDQKEVDAYDQRSAHSIVRHRPSGITASAVRLVLPDKMNRKALFPIEEHCASSFKSADLDWDSLPRDSIAEISRFAVSKSFKRRLKEPKKPVAGAAENTDTPADSGSGGALHAAHLTLGLFAGIVRMSAEHGITHWYAVMEPALLRLLSRFGIELTHISKPVKYHGYRQPCYAAIDEVLAGIWRKAPDVWKLITDNGDTWPAPEERRRKPRGEPAITIN